MGRKMIVLPILAVALVLLTVVLLTLDFLPFHMLKSLLDGLMPDGSFQSLNEGNVLVFKILLGILALLALLLALAVWTGQIRRVSIFFRHYKSDSLVFIKALKPGRIDVLFLILLVLILIAGATFRLARINDGMLHDESYTFMVFSSTSLLTPLIDYHLPNNHVFNSLLIYFSTHLFGIQPWAIRLPALLAGLLLIPATYSLGQRIYNKYTGLMAALLVAILPGTVMYSTVARGYSMVALFTVLALWLANYVRSHKNLFAWSMLVLCSTLGFFSVPVFLMPFGMVFAWLFFDNLFSITEEYGSRLKFQKYWLLAGFSVVILVLLCYTPIFIYTGVKAVFANEFVTPKPWLGYIASIPDYLGYAWDEWIDGFSPIWTYALFLGFLLGLVFHRRISHQRFPLQIAAIIWLGALLLIQRPIGVTKIWAFLQAPFMLWCGAGWMSILKNVNLKGKYKIPLAAITTGIAVLALVVAAVWTIPGIPQRWAEKSAEENVALFLIDYLEPEDLVVAAPPYGASIWYYSYLHGVARSHFNKDFPFSRIYLIYNPVQNQTKSFALQAYGLDQYIDTLGSARQIGNFQNLDIYLISLH